MNFPQLQQTASTSTSSPTMDWRSGIKTRASITIKCVLQCIVLYLTLLNRNNIQKKQNRRSNINSSSSFLTYLLRSIHAISMLTAMCLSQMRQLDHYSDERWKFLKMRYGMVWYSIVLYYMHMQVDILPFFTLTIWVIFYKFTAI